MSADCKVSFIRSVLDTDLWNEQMLDFDGNLSSNVFERISCWKQSWIATVSVISQAGNKDDIVLGIGSWGHARSPVNTAILEPFRTCSAIPTRNSLFKDQFHIRLLKNYWNNHICNNNNNNSHQAESFASDQIQYQHFTRLGENF